MSGRARGIAYCRGRLKRTIDVVLSGTALLVLSPLLALLVLLQLVTNGPPVVFRQKRVGMDGASFTLLKFRTMRVDGNRGPSITARGDRRITTLGRFLRASKLDELPQLLNVFRGEMSIVGPRPELEEYLRHYDAGQRRALQVRPGLTDPATLRFRDEERLMAAFEPDEREARYIREIMPEKLRLNLAYLERASPAFDLLLILRTLGAIMVRPRS